MPASSSLSPINSQFSDPISKVKPSPSSAVRIPLIEIVVILVLSALPLAAQSGPLNAAADAVRQSSKSPKPGVATYEWPGSQNLIPLTSKVESTLFDGIPETKLILSGAGTTFSMQFPHGLVIDEEAPDTSLILVNRMLPENRLALYLFRPGTFLPAVNRTTMESYRNGLLKQPDPPVVLEEDQELIPRKTFSILGHQWGRIRYSTAEAADPLGIVEFFVPLRGNLLVLRLEGMQSFVKTLEPRVERMLSTMEVAN